MTWLVSNASITNDQCLSKDNLFYCIGHLR